MSAPLRYAAFISYSHRDRKWAEWLHRAIETYRIPKDLDSESATQEALRPIFLDRAELPTSSDLAVAVREAMAAARHLIVVCSPAAAQSRWVNEEIRTFKSLGGTDRILCLIVAGEPRGGAASECFPPALRFCVVDGVVTDRPAAEPLAADVRPQKDSRRDAQLKIVAGLLRIPLDRLRQREHVRRQRRLAIIATAAGIGCVAFGTLAGFALLARAEAERQRLHAEQQSLTARRTADFLKSLFTVSDPSEARGNSITAREVLDRGVRQIGDRLKGEPQVRAELTTTLGEVYGGLGLLTEAEQLLTSARAVPSQPDLTVAREAAALGEVRQLRGEYASALPLLRQASRLLEKSPNTDYALKARLLGAFGDVYQGLNDYDTSRRSYAQLVLLAKDHAETGREWLARGLEGVAQADLEADRVDDAERELREALAAQVAATGELHPRTSEIINELGSLEYTRQNGDAAIAYFKRSLAIDQRVLGEHHPDLAVTLNNLARILLERRQFEEARKLLKEALDMRASQVLETNDLSAFIVTNLALADLGLSDYAAAEPLFLTGLKAAVANQHRLQAPILVDLADLECRTGRYQTALTRLDEARPMMAARYPDDPWRVAHVDNVRAGCLTGLGRAGEATQLMKASLPIVLERWPKDSLYGHDALARNTRLQALQSRSAPAQTRARAGRT